VWSGLLSWAFRGLCVGFHGRALGEGGLTPLVGIARGGRPFLHLHGMAGWMWGGEGGVVRCGKSDIW